MTNYASYSYLIYSFGKYLYTATCFFVSDRNDLFLVTADHTVSGFNSLTGARDEDIPKSFKIVLDRIKNIEYEIDISDYQQQFESFHFYLKPDVFFSRCQRNCPVKSTSLINGWRVLIIWMSIHGKKY